MQSWDASRSALAFCAIVIVLSACNSGGAQVTPLGPTRGTASFDLKKIQSTAAASVASGAHRVSPDGIVYAPANRLIENSSYNLDLNNDATTDFVIAESNTTSKPNCEPPPRGMNEFATLSLGTSQSSNGFETYSGYVARLTSGSPIGPSESFRTGSLDMEYTSVMWEQAGMTCVRVTRAEGNWFPGNKGYLGVAFVIRGKTHYGWAAIGVHGYYGYLIGRLTGYAYQTIAGKSIKAGQK